MFIYKTVARMRNTDASGVLYFTSQLEMALEAFEELLRQQKFSLRDMLNTADYHLPIVHSEANYLSPVAIGDEVEIHLTVSHIGTSSFTLAFDFVKGDSDIVAGNATITHVVVGGNKARPIPPELLHILQQQ